MRPCGNATHFPSSSSSSRDALAHKCAHTVCACKTVKCVVDFRAIFARNTADWFDRCSMHAARWFRLIQKIHVNTKRCARIKGTPRSLPPQAALFRISGHLPRTTGNINRNYDVATFAASSLSLTRRLAPPLKFCKSEYESHRLISTARVFPRDARRVKKTCIAV